MSKNIPKAKYDEYGGITNIYKQIDKSKNSHQKNKKSGYNFFERFLIGHSKKINYLLDKEGKYKCRKENIPQVIRIGPNNLCTARCAYCPREYIHDDGVGYMDFVLFEKIVDWAKYNEVETIAFALFGEPLLHPQIMDMIDLSHKKGLKMRLSTNGIILTEELTEKLLKYPFEALEFSMDGFTREEFIKGKQVDKYEKAKKNVEYYLKRAKEEKVKTRFNVHFVDIGNVSFKNKTKFVRYWKKQLKNLKYTTSFYYEPHNWAGTRNDLRDQMSLVDRILSKVELKKPCVYVKGLNINYNGDVIICTNDPTKEAVIGNIKNTKIEDIYNGKERKKFLDKNEKGNFEGVNCDVCTVNSVLPLMFIKKKIINKIAGFLS